MDFAALADVVQSRLGPRRTLIALDAPPASYVWQVSTALAEGATPEDIIGVLIAIAPQVGGPKLVAAAPELMIALGLSLPDDM